MHPALAGLIGAGLAVLVCLFAYLIVRGRENWRRLEAQQAAALVADEVRAILLTLREGALLVGPHDEIVVVNEAGEALSLARGSRVGFPELLVTVREVRASGRPFDGTIVREVQPGTERLEVAAHVRPLGNDRVLVLGVDESGERRVEAVRRDFVANISHELKTPIGAISVLSEALAAARDDPEAVDLFSGRLQRETARLAELINQIIDLSRLQSEDPMLSRELVDVGEVVAEAVSRSQERATQRGVGLIVAHTDVVRVMGDRWHSARARSLSGKFAANRPIYASLSARRAVWHYPAKPPMTSCPKAYPVQRIHSANQYPVILFSNRWCRLQPYRPQRCHSGKEINPYLSTRLC